MPEKPQHFVRILCRHFSNGIPGHSFLIVFPGIVVRTHGYGRIGIPASLARMASGGNAHIDDVRPPRPKHPGLCPGGKAGAFYSNDGSFFMVPEAQFFKTAIQYVTQSGVKGIGHGAMHGISRLEVFMKCHLALPGKINELIRHDKIPAGYLFPQRANCRTCQNMRTAGLSKRMNIGTIIDLRRRMVCSRHAGREVPAARRRFRLRAAARTAPHKEWKEKYRGHGKISGGYPVRCRR